jgi:predicted P-loop ATPase
MTITKTINNMLRHIKYEAALEEQNTLLRRQLDTIHTRKKQDDEDTLRNSARRYLWPIEQMKTFVSQTYEFRHNIVTDVNEYRRVADGKTAPYVVINDRELNTIALDIQMAGIFCLDRYVKQFIDSKFATEYHPVTEYLDTVRGTWDGTDRTADLLRRITTSDYCLRMGRIWLRAVVAQWLGIDSEHANSVMLLLVSLQQGMQKSTFLRCLLPPQLTDYYTDDFSLSAKGNAQRKMVEYAIINCDEFDKEKPAKMPLMKTLMQTMKPSFIGAYKKNFNRLPRIASFTGTSNTRELLHDHSGSRRFLILEPDGPIDITGINHDQLYAQLIYEVEHGEQYHFDSGMETEMQCHNRAYYVKSPIENLFGKFFRAAADGEDCRQMTAAEILTSLDRHNHHIMRDTTKIQMGRILHAMNIPVVHSEYSNTYRVVEL